MHKKTDFFNNLTKNSTNLAICSESSNIIIPSDIIINDELVSKLYENECALISFKINSKNSIKVKQNFSLILGEIYNEEYNNKFLEIPSKEIVNNNVIIIMDNFRGKLYFEAIQGESFKYYKIERIYTRLSQKC